MQYGMVKCAAATPRIKVADCAYNAEQAIAMMDRAADAGVQLLVLPELCLTGYTCGDLFLQRTLLEGALAALARVVKARAKLDLVTVLGLPIVKDGKLYNCAAVVQGGRVLGMVPKTHLPNYNEFYELRNFAPAPEGNTTVRIGGEEVPFGTKLLFCCQEEPLLVLAAEICEDLWAPEPPSIRHALAGATVIANLSASDETIGKDAYRRRLVAGQSARLMCGYLYADAGDGESTTDMVFAGHNLVAEDGLILAETAPFRNGLAVSEIDLQRLEHERRRTTTFPPCQDAGYLRISFHLGQGAIELTRAIPTLPFVPADGADRQSRCEMILAMQAQGLQSRLAHAGSKTAVVGISGGLDSCLALLVAARAMDRLGRPRTDIVAVTMPCFGTTERTRRNAEQLSLALGVTLQCVDITESVLLHFRDIGHDPDARDVTYENAQARERTQVLMDVANRTGGLVVGTGDLSELALGWATYNGDHMSMYGVNASVPKTLIRHIVRYEADNAGEPALREVLYDILDTPVSPELLPAKDGKISQETESIVGPYELHDFFLYYAIRWAFTPAKVLFLARAAFGEREDILPWLKVFYRRFFAQQFKRSCLPDGPKVGSVTLSPRGDWRMPSDASCALWQAELERL